MVEMLDALPEPPAPPLEPLPPAPTVTEGVPTVVKFRMPIVVALAAPPAFDPPEVDPPPPALPPPVTKVRPHLYPEVGV
jgi:hypothetical protein